MLAKSDLKSISRVVKEELDPIKQDVGSLKTDVSSLRTNVSSLKTDVSSLKTDVSVLKTGVSELKTDVNYIKRKLDDLSDFARDSITQLMEWSNDIHNSIVKENLPERVKKLEQTLKSS